MSASDQRDTLVATDATGTALDLGQCVTTLRGFDFLGTELHIFVMRADVQKLNQALRLYRRS